MNYLSLDIETTGLDKEKCQILQIAAVYMSGGKEVARVNLYINQIIRYGEPVALAMNAKTLSKIAEKGPDVYSEFDARACFRTFINSLPGEKIVVAGKNVATFDLPFLTTNQFYTERFSYRVMDIGPLYAPEFGYIPSISEINKLLGRPPVSHDALEDCLDVVAAIEAKVKK